MREGWNSYRDPPPFLEVNSDQYLETFSSG